MDVEAKKVDQFGRVGLPKAWREKEIFMLEYPDHVKIKPKKKVNLTEFFDIAEIDTVEFTDYHKFKEEVLKKRFGG
ncbi:MAG: AbrB family transcriptional regulator [Candidatus Hadarchaeota archaeon]